MSDVPHDNMRVIHVVSDLLEASGAAYAALRLCEALIDGGTDARVAALDQAGAPTSNEMPPTAPRAYVDTFPRGRGPKRYGRSPQMHHWLDAHAASGELDVIHSHSLWRMPNVYPGKVCQRHQRCSFVVSPHGTLSSGALGFKALRKKIAWRLLQEPALRRATCFHATADREYEDIRRLGFRQPVCVFPNGIDVPLLDSVPRPLHRQLLFLGRVHPTKGVDTLLRAWAVVQHRFRDWELHIVGPDDEGHLSDMRTLAERLATNRVIFRGPLYGDARLQAYRAASLFVLPTHTENFGMVVAEALAAGTPAIVTTGAPWSGLRDEEAGWWIDIGVDPLVACLEEALATSPDRLAQMGQAGRRWMVRDYDWRRAGEQCVATYRWLLEGGEVPACVRLH